MKKLLLSLILGLGISTTVFAGTVLFPYGGGTGTSTAPTQGQLLIGNSIGTYNLVSTSSLGINSAIWGMITGTLSNQTDLQNSLNSKLSTTTASITYPTFTYSSSTFPSFTYASSTYYFATNPAGYITVSALTPYLSTTTASLTYQPILSGTMGDLAYWSSSSGLGSIATGTNGFALISSSTSATGYDWKTLGGGGTVMSVGIATSSGISVSGTNPITGSGTFTLGVQSGYLIPLSASTTQWNNLYNASNSLPYIPFASSTLYYLASNPSSYISSILADLPLLGAGTSTSHLSLPKASSTHDGYLSSTDWGTFNGKQNALSLGNLTETVSNIFNIVGGTGATVGNVTLEIKKASSTQNGYLSSTDWSTFNNKQPAGAYLTGVLADSPLSGDGTSGNHLIFTNPGYITNSVSNLTNYPTYTYASSTFASTSWITSTFPTYAYASSTFASTTWINTLNIPLVASSTNWNNLYNNVLSRLGISTSTTGTGWYISTSTNSLTLNIPMASGAGVVAGLLSKTDYDIFNGKQNTLSGTLGGLAYWSSSSGLGSFATGTTGYALVGSTTSATGLDWKALTTGTVTSLSVTTQNGVSGSFTSAPTPALSLTLGNIIPTKVNDLTFATTSTGFSVSTTSQALLVIGSSTLNKANDSGTNTGDITLAGTTANNGLTLSGQALTLGLASGSATGTLSATDWTTFNNKQNALTNPITGTGATNTLAYWTSASTVGTLATGTANTYLRASSTSATGFDWSSLAGNLAGSDTQVQYNNGGVFGASNNLTYGASSWDSVYKTLNIYASSSAFAPNTSNYIVYPLTLTDKRDIDITSASTTGVGIDFSQNFFGGKLGLASIAGVWNPVTTNGDLTFLTGLAMGGAQKENMRLDSAGNLLIGTTSPSAKLDIYGTVGTEDIFGVSSSSNSRLFTIKSSGNVGIGTTTSSGNMLNVAGNIYATGTISSPTLSGTNTGNVTLAGNSIANGLTLSGQALTLGLASGSATGTLSATDWTTFNNKISSTSLAWTIGNGLIYNSTSTDSVGIGTTTPSAKLEVYGTAGNNAIANFASSSNVSALYIGANGRVGIGTTSPANILDINSDTASRIRLSGSSSGITVTNGQWGAGLYLYNKDATVGNYNALVFGNAYPSWTSGIVGINKGHDASANRTGELGFITFNAGTATEIMRITSSRNIGIGTTTPAAKLEVYGTAGDNAIANFASSTNTSALYIAPTGYVGIGTASPDSVLDVIGTPFSTVYGSVSAFVGRRANGTVASPTQVLVNNAITTFGARPYLSDTGLFSTCAK